MRCRADRRNHAWGAVTLLAITASPSLFAQTSTDLGGAIYAWLSPEITHYDAAASGSLDWEGTVRLDDGMGTYERTVTRGSLRIQPWADAHNEVQLTGSMAESITRTSATLLPDGEFPTHLYDFRTGGFYRHVDTDGVIYGGTASVGSADRQLFSSWQGTTLSSSLFLRLPTVGKNAWLFSLSYSNDRSLFNNVPLPGVAFEWHPDPTVTAVFGLPIMYAVWHPNTVSDLDASTSILGYAHVGGWYKPFTDAPFLRITSAIDYSSEIYKWPGHIDSDESIFFRGTRASVGLSLKASPLIGASAYTGYLFDRAVLMGQSILRYTDALPLRPAYVFGVSAQLGF